MRAGAWGEVAAVPGIECAGVIEADPSGRLSPGTPVVAILGGMGRTRNGSYAELVTVAATNVAVVNSSLGWAELAAVPEVYASVVRGCCWQPGPEARRGSWCAERPPPSARPLSTSPSTTVRGCSRPPGTPRTRRS
ncbi:hypothetical protein ACFH04_00005 [Streptomyces noboritoensis]|uniref:Alcohol dehydrogenase N-terminal domain-containing protein n=1 Tax=Streptomyces noboritoensis TaxID=67337 RepID=A0ABV6T8M0_9ACTN